MVIGEKELYRKGTSGILMRCISKEDGRRLLKEIHSGICGNHAASRTLVGKAYRQGFFWPTAVTDADELVRKCEGGNMKNGVRIQMNEFYLIEMQKTPEESTGGDEKTTIEERFENHDLTGVSGGESFSVGSAPPDDFLLGKNSILHHPVEVFLSDSGRLP